MSKHTTKRRSPRPDNLTIEETVYWYKQNHVVVRDNGCWELPDVAQAQGYPMITFDGRTHKLTRLFYMVLVGPITQPCLRHTCDNPACVNPAHLLQGTKKQNTRDMVERNRHCHGSKHPLALITEDDVRDIRQAYKAGETHKQIAARYGVSREHIGCIVRRRFWKHVE